MANQRADGGTALLGKPAPDFALPSIQGGEVSLAALRGDRRVVLWFSRGFTCTFCRSYMAGIIDAYDALQADRIEVLQVAPNLFDTAQRFFRPPPPFPFLCDPDKRLYALYGLGDRGVLSAMGNTFVTFGHAFTHGDGINTVRASWMDVANRNFVTRMHHHALTAMDQAIVIVDANGMVREHRVYRALEAIPDGAALRDMVADVCA